jgi:hypothetical protein
LPPVTSNAIYSRSREPSRERQYGNTDRENKREKIVLPNRRTQERPQRPHSAIPGAVRSLPPHLIPSRQSKLSVGTTNTVAEAWPLLPIFKEIRTRQMIKDLGRVSFYAIRLILLSFSGCFERARRCLCSRKDLADWTLQSRWNIGECMYQSTEGWLI